MNGFKCFRVRNSVVIVLHWDILSHTLFRAAAHLSYLTCSGPSIKSLYVRKFGSSRFQLVNHSVGNGICPDSASWRLPAAQCPFRTHRFPIQHFPHATRFGKMHWRCSITSWTCGIGAVWMWKDWVAQGVRTRMWQHRQLSVLGDIVPLSPHAQYRKAIAMWGRFYPM